MNMSRPQSDTRFRTQQDLIGPMTLEEFQQRYWRRETFVRRGAPGRFDDLFSPADIDEMLAAMANVQEDCFFFRAAEDIPRALFSDADGRIQLNKLIALYREGGTLHLRNIQRVMPRLESLWRDMTMRNRAAVKINFWQTRQNNLTPFLHYDTHDIFILQIHGEKDWTLYNHAAHLLAPRAGNVNLLPEQVGAPVEQVRMGPGDLLYLPAGTPHQVTTCAPHSVHLAIGVHHVLWRDVLDIALAELDRRGTALTQAVPLDLLHGEPAQQLTAAFQAAWAQAADGLDAALTHVALTNRFLQHVTPPRDDHFTREVMRDDPFTAECQVRRRADLPCLVRVAREAGISEILFAGGGGVEGPADIEHLLRFVAASDGPIKANDLPNDYDVDSRLTLLIELTQLGLLARV